MTDLINKMQMYGQVGAEILERHNGSTATMSMEEKKIMKEAMLCLKEGLESMQRDFQPTFEFWENYDCGANESESNFNGFKMN